MNDKVDKSLANLRAELTRIPQDTLDHFIESLNRHSYAARLDAHHMVRNLLARGGSCSKTDLLVVSGRDQTDGTGKTTLPIGSLLCGAVTEGVFLMVVREPYFVATPLGTTPSFVTAATSSTELPHGQYILTDRDGNTVDAKPLDVKVEVMTWKHDGTALPNTFFSWICTIEAARPLDIGG